MASHEADLQLAAVLAEAVGIVPAPTDGGDLTYQMVRTMYEDARKEKVVTLSERIIHLTVTTSRACCSTKGENETYQFGWKIIVVFLEISNQHSFKALHKMN